MKGWVGFVGWPIADSLPSKWSPVQLLVRHTAGQGNFAGQGPAFYHCAMLLTVLHRGLLLVKTTLLCDWLWAHPATHSQYRLQHCILSIVWLILLQRRQSLFQPCMVRGERTRRTIRTRTFERICTTITETDLPIIGFRTYTANYRIFYSLFITLHDSELL